jgi:hypothetical protein
MNKYLIIALLVSFSFLGNAQDTENLSRKEKKALKKAKMIEETKALLDSKVYLFDPNRALPSGMRSINLDGTFFAKINKDTLNCYLPYYGRAYSVDYGSNEGPLNFTQPIQNYSMEESKKGYTVKFNVKNKNDNINFMFTISETGSASLNLNSTNRQSISYHGIIEKPEN